MLRLAVPRFIDLRQKYFRRHEWRRNEEPVTSRLTTINGLECLGARMDGAPIAVGLQGDVS